MILMLKANQRLLNFLMIRRFIHFYDSLNIVLILDPGCEFFCAKGVPFSLMTNLIKK